MDKKITVLGAGMVGKAIIYDLSEKFQVTAADKNKEALNYCQKHYDVSTIQADLKSLSGDIEKAIEASDLVVSAVPGFLGYKTVETCIKKGKDVVDISFMPEDFMQLDHLAKENNVTVVTDCGVAPGMPNLILGHWNKKMEIKKFEYMVGGLPKERKFPFEYKAPFSPIDVLEEYTRPARMMENGKVVSKPAMSEPELIYFEKLGHLEAFNTDGLRSILDSMKHISNMKEKTLRYPGHIRLIEALKTSGFFSDKALSINDQFIKPIDVTNQVLMDEWKLKPEEPEFTIMRIILEGAGNKIIYNLYDEYDAETKLSSMARTTGFTATAAANMILEGLFKEKGIFPPELIGSEERCYNYIIDFLEQRNIVYTMEKD